ncbi:putative PurR-regulated permease PerM [Sphingomonas jinjuensis]|uniref:Putative PurR-regulated permease PerM n=1 Tax=Sphingomonas jinjuensis TaxID=535907 RepID=A0A840FHS9_9SPHN|nr:AI-2E family transporter [Sphingomonas jinjuensis]MBB4155247.1 putative PurR-regulated permease PerM [Sphingomonas jinjuensis]
MTDGRIDPDTQLDGLPDTVLGVPAGLPTDEALRIAMRRDRLLAALTLTAGIGLVLATPFALKAGAEFFLPVTASLVIAIALVPVLEWLERRGLPSPIAALLCVVTFLIIANIAIAAIVVPATDFFRLLPSRISRIQENLSPLLDLYSTLEKSVNKMLRQVASTPVVRPQAAAVAPPSSIVELAATSAPAVIIQLLFAVLTVFFFLSGWSKMRRRTITGRTSFDGAMATARVIQDVVDDVSAYLGTITLINVCLGLSVALALYFIGMPYPLMWGGIVTLLNYVPYFGPVLGAFLLAVGGLMTFNDIWLALLPPAIMYGFHLVEANAITPLIVGHRLTINPVMILISLSFWGWVWGTVGALLAVPLLIILQTVLDAAGKPDIAGFLFEHGTLVQQRGRRKGPEESVGEGG